MMKIKKNIGAALILTSILGAGFAQAETRTAPMNDPTSPNYIGPNYDRTYPVDDAHRYQRPHQEEQQSVSQNNPSYEDKTIRDEVFGIAPQLGALNFTNRNRAYTSRALEGLSLSFNLIPLTNTADNRDLYLGFTTGALYSHTGSDSGNFFGSDANVQNTDNANLLMIPADVKIGYNLTPGFRMSAHGGGNVIYRSVASAMDLGADSNVNDSLWRIYPNAGIDAEWQVGKNVSLMLRPDLTFTSGTSLFAATLGATIVDL